MNTFSTINTSPVSFVHPLSCTLGLPYVKVICILFSLVSSLVATSPKCAAYQTCCSVMVSGRQTEISGGHNV